MHWVAANATSEPGREGASSLTPPFPAQISEVGWNKAEKPVLTLRFLLCDRGHEIIGKHTLGWRPSGLLCFLRGVLYAL